MSWYHFAVLYYHFVGILQIHYFVVPEVEILNPDNVRQYGFKKQY